MLDAQDNSNDMTATLERPTPFRLPEFQEHLL